MEIVGNRVLVALNQIKKATEEIDGGSLEGSKLLRLRMFNEKINSKNDQ